MPSSPALTLVDPRKRRRRYVLQRLLAIALGTVVIGASALPFLNSL